MSVAVAAPPAAFRVFRAPLLDPPFDDELTPGVYQPPPAAAVPESAVPESAVPESVPDLPLSPACHNAAVRFLNICLELFNGFRAPVQLRPLLQLEHLLALLDELVKTCAHLAEMRRSHGGSRIRRLGLRMCEPRPGVAEAAAVLEDGVRTWAMCYRLEYDGSVWRCTYIHSALPPIRTLAATARRNRRPTPATPRIPAAATPTPKRATLPKRETTAGHADTPDGYPSAEPATPKRTTRTASAKSRSAPDAATTDHPTSASTDRTPTSGRRRATQS